MAKRRQRRALSHVGGHSELRGDDASARLLAGALAVRSDEDATRAHVHGFHSYTARMHPLTARRLVHGLSRPGAAVLDPFCGSGTVLVEARILGRRAVGVDANPLAVALARLKTGAWRSGDLDRLVATAQDVAAAAEARRRAKAGATRSYGALDRELFDAHVLFELDGLQDGLARLHPGEITRALWLVLSSILTKVSRQPGDTSDAQDRRGIARGFAIRMFAKRAHELARQLDEFTSRLPAKVPPPKLTLGDARELDGIAADSIDLIVTSPPYPGVYDYLEHHLTRLRWLGLDAKGFAEREIGSRRELDRLGPKAVARWKEDYGACLAAMARVLGPRGRAVLLLADAAIGEVPLPADELTHEIAPRVGLELAASASQRRPHFHGATRAAFRTRARYEHALLLQPANLVDEQRSGTGATR